MAWVGNTKDDITNSELQDLIRLSFQSFLPARVLSIDDSENLSNGDIICDILTPQSILPNQKIISASPLYANVKSYPLINEVVFLIPGPSGDYSSNPNKTKYYYLSSLKIWNSIHTNPTPSPYTNLNSNSQNKNISEIEAGSANKSGEQNTNEFKPGTYFQEKSDIYSLYPFEGDIIYEGRWGQSIRFGSTNIRTTGGNKTINRSNAFGANETFILGNTTPTTLNHQLSVASARVKQFSDKYDNVTVITSIGASESQVTNPNNIPPGGLAQQRLDNTLSVLSSFPLLNKDIRSNTLIGSTPYTPGVDNPNDPKYTSEQSVTINVSVRGTETINEPENEIPLNVWSTTGSAGDPLLIFRNGQNPELLSPAQSTTIEDINKDLSSLYLTSTQKLPIEVSSQNDYLSYGENKPIEPNQYSGAQAIISSGRLLFNSTQDHILLSSQKSINLNSQESVNIDARSGMVIQTPELYLGGIETSQPVVLGNDLVDLLGKVLTDLEYLTGALQNQLGVPVGSPIGPTNLVAQAVNDKIGGYKAELSNVLSNTTKTV